MMNKRIAIKILKKKLHASPTLLKEFETEAKKGEQAELKETAEYYLYITHSTPTPFIFLLRLHDIPFTIESYD